MLQRSSDYNYPIADEPITPAIERLPQPTVDLRQMARILRRRWKVVAAIPLALLTVALIYVMPRAASCSNTHYISTYSLIYSS